MNAVKYLKERARMCREYMNCSECPLNGEHGSCLYRQDKNPEESVSIVARWSEEHSQKTLKDDFLEKFPNARMSTLKFVPAACVNTIYGNNAVTCVDDCVKCWNKPISEVK